MGKAVHHIIERDRHRAEGRMMADLVIRAQLQRKQEVALPLDPAQRSLRGKGAGAGAGKFQQPAQPFADDRVRAVRGVKGKTQPAGDHMMIMPVAVAGAAAEIGGNGRQFRYRGQPARVSGDNVRVALEGRMTVHAIALQRHPIGPDIALFIDMDMNAPQLGHAQRNAVHRAAIAKQHEIGNGVVAGKSVKKGRPASHATAKRGGLAGPVIMIAARKIDPHNLCASPVQRLRQFKEKRPRRPLQEQKTTRRRLYASPRHMTPVTHTPLQSV